MVIRGRWGLADKHSLRALTRVSGAPAGEPAVGMRAVHGDPRAPVRGGDQRSGPGSPERVDDDSGAGGRRGVGTITGVFGDGHVRVSAAVRHLLRFEAAHEQIPGALFHPPVFLAARPRVMIALRYVTGIRNRAASLIAGGADSARWPAEDNRPYESAGERGVVR